MRRFFKLIAILVILISFASCIFGDFALSKELTIHFIDVGQGDSILIITPEEKAILIDAGDIGKGDDVVEYLEGQGVKNLDLVIATHPHADHIGGMKEILNTFPIGTFLDSGQVTTTKTFENMLKLIEEKDIRFVKAKAGLKIKLQGDEIVMNILNPPETFLTGTRSDLNSNCIVARLVFNQFSALFMGDAEHETELELERAGYELKSDILKVAHHGSAYTTMNNFLERAIPKIAIISVGENRYGHPAEETIKRLIDKEIEIYRTDKDGTVVISTDGKGYRIETEKPHQNMLEGNQMELVNINTATQEELEALPFIGPAKARAIIEYRKQHGLFKTTDELLEVKGIGEKTFDAIKELITI